LGDEVLEIEYEKSCRAVKFWQCDSGGAAAKSHGQSGHLTLFVSPKAGSRHHLRTFRFDL
jgi:hypothetical protein